MPKPRVPAAPTTPSQRRVLFEIWQLTGNVARACRAANVGRRTFYYWKPRFDAGGYAALEQVQSSAPKQPHRIPDTVVAEVIALRRAHPTWGKRRIARELASATPGVPPPSATTVERLLTAAGLWTHRAASIRTTELSSVSPSGDPLLPLLATKFARPRVPPVLVHRERLLRQLDVALRHRLTLVSAAAGWGKSTLLSAWAAGHVGPVAWLSLDELDNDPTRFWIALIAALRTALPTLGTTTLAMLRAPEPAPAAAIVTMLLAELVNASASLVLILDDVHVVDDPAVYAGLTRLVEQLPPQLHLVLASRVDPALPLARWRVRGDLAELRAAELGFTAHEVGTFFAHTLDDGLPDADVQRLHRRTEGWIAGLQLAALALRQHPDRAALVAAFTGSHRYVLDYVQQEILLRQPPAVQRFLVQAALLRRLTAPLCAAVTGEEDSQALLETLERGNLFVVPLDDTRQWYRMHDLFREVLLARLQATEPALIPQLHRRAAHWYAAHDQVSEAITHALVADDGAYAAALIARVAPELWLRGEAQTVQRWLAALPESSVLQHARLQLEAALRLLEATQATVREQYQDAEAQVAQTIARIEAELPRPGETRVAPAGAGASRMLADAEVALLRQRIGLLRAFMATRSLLMHGDVDGMRALMEQTAALAAEEEVRWKLVAVTIAFWLAESLLREGAVLLPRLLEVKQQAIAAGDEQSTLRVMRMLAAAYERAGRLQQCEHECRHALALSERLGVQSSSSGYFHLYVSGNCFESNRLDQAEQHTHDVLRIARQWQQLDLLATGWVGVIGIALARRDLGTAATALDELEALFGDERFATHTGAVAALRVEYWLAAGNVEAARAWAAQMTIPTDPWNPNRKWEVLQLIKVQLARREAQEALATIDRYRMYLERPGDSATTIWFLALEVVALHQAGQAAPARAVAARLLALTESDGYIRVYLDAGAPMQDVLRSVYHTQLREATGRVLASTAFVARVLAAFAQQTPAQSTPAPPSQPTAPPVEGAVPARAHEPTALHGLVEPLTPREQEVLGLLLSGASNTEIAAALVIARATVKKHVGNVLAKLGVANRTQVLARAHDWSPLP